MMKLNKIEMDGKTGYTITMDLPNGVLLKEWLPMNTEIGANKSKIVECMAIEAILRRILYEGLKDIPELNLTMDNFKITRNL